MLLLINKHLQGLLLMHSSRGLCEGFALKLVEEDAVVQLDVIDLIARVTAVHLLPWLLCPLTLPETQVVIW